MTWTATLGWAFTAYALLTGFYIALENRRPQATLAWMLLFLLLPGAGLAVYLLFGRDRKAFSRERELARQDLRANAAPLLGPLLARQDAEIDRLEGQSPVRRRLMQLVRHNSHSLLTTRHRVEIQQDAAAHYASLIEDLEVPNVRSISSTSSGPMIPSRGAESDPGRAGQRRRRGAPALRPGRLALPSSAAAITGASRGRRKFTSLRPRPSGGCTRCPTATTARSRSIDGRVGYTGGMNIGQEHLDGGPHASHPGATRIAHRGRGCRRAAGRVPGRLVQRHGPRPFREGSLPAAWSGVGRGDSRSGTGARCRRAGADPDLRARTRSGGRSGSSTSP